MNVWRFLAFLQEGSEVRRNSRMQKLQPVKLANLVLQGSVIRRRHDLLATAGCSQTALRHQAALREQLVRATLSVFCRIRVEKSLCFGQIVMGSSIIWLDLQGLLEFPDCFRQAPRPFKGIAQIVMGLGKIRR